MGHNREFVELSDLEQEAIEKVLARDEALRNLENRRISSNQAEVEKLDSRVDILSKDKFFNENHCLQCFSQFMILFNPTYKCSNCQRNYCKKCLQLIEKEKLSLCLFCRKKLASESQKNSWFYENGQNNFKLFGSDKIKRLLSRGRSDGEDNDDDSYGRTALVKRPSFGDLISAFRTSIDTASDSGFSTTSSRRNFTLLPDLTPPAVEHATDLSKDVDLEVMIKNDADRTSSWNLTPIKNRIPFSVRDNYYSATEDANNNIHENQSEEDRRSSLSSQDALIDDDLVDNNQPTVVTSRSTISKLPPQINSRLRSTPPPINIVDGDSPVFQQLPEDVQVDAGSSAEFVCVVDGTLPIEVYWYREGSELIRIDETETQKYVVSKAGRSHGFVVMETAASDRGYYMCIAVNEYGRKEHMVKLTVLDDADPQQSETNLPPTNQQDVSSLPTPSPRSSRSIVTEVIRCGDFSLSDGSPSIRHREIFPDVDYVPLSNMEKGQSSARASLSAHDEIDAIARSQSPHMHTHTRQNHETTTGQLTQRPAYNNADAATQLVGVRTSDDEDANKASYARQSRESNSRPRDQPLDHWATADSADVVRRVEEGSYVLKSSFSTNSEDDVFEGGRATEWRGERRAMPSVKELSKRYSNSANVTSQFGNRSGK